MKIAMLGAWHVHAKGYAQEILKRDDCSIVCVWDNDGKRGKAFADELKTTYESELRAALNEADAVVVNASTNIHKETIISAARAGKHIFTEKVLASTAAEAYAIRDEVKKAGKSFLISLPFRGFSSSLCVKENLNALGKITAARIRNAHDGASAGWLPPHFYDPIETQGGAMMDLGAHPMYLLLWLLGKPTHVSSAFTHTTKKDVEDNAICLLKYENGALAVSETGFVSSNSPYSLEVFGEKASLRATRDFVELFIDGASKKIENWPSPTSSPINLFVDGVLKGGPLPYNIDDAVALSEVMDAAYRSHKSGKFEAL